MMRLGNESPTSGLQMQLFPQVITTNTNKLLHQRGPKSSVSIKHGVAERDLQKDHSHTCRLLAKRPSWMSNIVTCYTENQNSTPHQSMCPTRHTRGHSTIKKLATEIQRGRPV